MARNGLFCRANICWPAMWNAARFCILRGKHALAWGNEINQLFIQKWRNSTNQVETIGVGRSINRREGVQITSRVTEEMVIGKFSNLILNFSLENPMVTETDGPTITKEGHRAGTEVGTVAAAREATGRARLLKRASMTSF